MPKGGQNRKSADQHKLDGTFQPCRHAKRGVQATGSPERPSWFDPTASELWEQVITSLPAGVVGSADTALLIALCEAWSLYRKAADAAKKKPTDKNARIAFTSYLYAFDRIAAKFGLSPGDRERLPKIKPSDDGTDDRFFSVVQ